MRAFACKFETLKSLHSHALLILSTLAIETLKSFYSQTLDSNFQESSGAGTKDSLKISQVAHARLAQRRACSTLMADVLGYIPTGGWISKPLMPTFEFSLK